MQARRIEFWFLFSTRKKPPEWSLLCSGEAGSALAFMEINLRKRGDLKYNFRFFLESNMLSHLLYIIAHVFNNSVSNSVLKTKKCADLLGVVENV